MLFSLTGFFPTNDGRNTRQVMPGVAIPYPYHDPFGIRKGVCVRKMIDKNREHV